MHVRHLLVLLTLCAGTLPGAALAQAIPAKPATLQDDLRVKFINQQASDRLGSKLIGGEIENKANTKIGSIADIVFDEKNTIRSFVVSVGGILGIGSKYVAVDPSAVLVTVDDGKTSIVIDTDADQLKAAPEYRYLSDKKTGN